MTENEFQEAVHNYQTNDRMEALRDTMLYQNKGVDCVAVDFGEQGYGLMLTNAALLMELPIISTRLPFDNDIEIVI